MTRIDPILPNIYRISAFNPHVGITFNQFLIVDEQPALIHTGTHPMYDEVRKAVAQVIDPKTLACMIVPHFESDECGGMGRFAKEAPAAVLACSEVGAAVNLAGWDYAAPVKAMRDGSILELGRHRLRFLETPHVHHWDSMMVYEETTCSLFPADLFLQPGEQPPIVRENLGTAMCHLYREVGIFGGREPVLQAVNRIERLDPNWIHPMHGGSIPKEAIAPYIAALRTQPFEYQGKVFGRMLEG